MKTEGTSLRKAEAEAKAERLIDAVRKEAFDSHIKVGIDAWDNRFTALALAVFEDQNYHEIAEAIYEFRGGKR